MKFILEQPGLPAAPAVDVLVEKIKNDLMVPGYNQPLDFLKLPLDQDTVDQVKNLARDKNNGGVKWVILVGVGGSSLGAAAVYRAVTSATNSLSTRQAELTILDTVDSVDMSRVLTKLKNIGLAVEEIILVVVGKSGATTETAANAAVIYQALVEKFGQLAKERVVAVTDRQSPLWDLAVREEFAVLAIPTPVGGRFSLFSAAGLLPLALCGIDIEALTAGAKTMTDTLMEEAKKSAVFLAEQNKLGKNIHDLFFFAKNLEEVGKWYRQLLAESLGKDGKGLTPTVSIGSSDLHSQAQLVFGGPPDKITTIITVEQFAADVIVPPTAGFASLVDGLGGKSLAAILAAISQSTTEVYREAGLPVMEIKLERLDLVEIGALMQFFMVQVVCLAELIGVDPYGQPAVEQYKDKTRSKLLA